jgi:hypothetical protein
LQILGVNRKLLYTPCPKTLVNYALKSAYWEAVPIFYRVLQAFDIPHAQKEKKAKKGRENEARQLPRTI